MNLIFFGIQGSGKGTQAKLLAKDENYVVFETGGRLRELAKEDSKLGQKVKETINAGHLVSTELVMEIVEEFINKHQNEKIIFDGIPRSPDQNEALKELLKKHNLDYLAVHFTLSEDEAMKRLLKRAEIEGRADDNKESIKKRIEIFYEKTKPLLDNYEEEGKLIEIDGSPSIEEVYQSLTEALDNYGN